MNKDRVSLYVKLGRNRTAFVSEVVAKSCKGYRFDANARCAGRACKLGKIVIETSDMGGYPENVFNAIAVPILDDSKSLIGVFELLNSDKSLLNLGATNILLAKYAVYIALLFSSKNFLKVLSRKRNRAY